MEGKRDEARAAPPDGEAPDEHAAHGANADERDAMDDATVAGGADGSGADQAHPGEEIDLERRLAEAEAARDEYLAHLQRVKAEFDNYRKRVMREGTAQREAGGLDVLSGLLDVVDEFELAVLASEGSTDVDALHRGVELLYAKLIDVLRSHGVERIGEEAVPFDPELHDAVQQVDDGEQRDAPVVVEVLRAGYAAKGKVLRPAMVKVAR